MSKLKRRHTFEGVCSLSFFLVDVVMEQLDDEINVGQNHAAATVAFAAELIERVSC